MPKLDPEIKEQIKFLLDQGHITEGQAKVLKAYFQYEKRIDAANAAGIKLGTIQGILSDLTNRAVLIKIKKGAYIFNENEAEIIPLSRKVEFPPDLPLVITDEERKWMLKDYNGRNRSEAAKKLGRSKYDINRMAIELGLDRNN